MDQMDEYALRRELCQTARALWMRGLLVADQGLLSVKVHRRRFLVTPPGIRRCDLTDSALAIVDIEGLTIMGQGRLNAGCWRPHRIAYQLDYPSASRLDAPGATVLAMGPMTEALLRSTDADHLQLAQLDRLPVLDSDDEDHLAGALASNPAIAVRALGILSTGSHLAAAANRLECIEHAATVELACRNHRH